MSSVSKTDRQLLFCKTVLDIITESLPIGVDTEKSIGHLDLIIPIPNLSNTTEYTIALEKSTKHSTFNIISLLKKAVKCQRIPRLKYRDQVAGILNYIRLHKKIGWINYDHPSKRRVIGTPIIAFVEEINYTNAYKLELEKLYGKSN